MRKATYILIIVIVPCLLAYRPKEDGLTEIISKIENYFGSTPMEKVYLHLDKPYYTKGDRIWFKAYNLIYSNNQPSSLSEILYVTITNQNGELIETIKLPLNNGVGDGYFDIPKNLNDNIIQISAFTNWMRNFDESLYFKHVLSIDGDELKFNPDENSDFNISIFPEGGQVIEKKLTKIGYRVNFPSDANGVILKNKLDTVSLISSSQYGYGVFSIVPDINDTYELVFDYNGKYYRSKVPPAKKSGTTLKVEDKGNVIQITSLCSNEFNKTRSYILIQHNGSILFSLDSEFENYGILTQIKKELLPEGLISFSQFNKDGNLLNQRLWFNEGVKSKIDISSPGNIATRENIPLNINSNDLGMVEASISIVPNKYFNQDNMIDIQQYIHLISGTDMISSSPIPISEVNDILITHKLLAYNLNDIISSKKQEFKYEIEKRNLFTFRGNVNNKELTDKGDVYGITLSGKDHDFYFDRFDKDGSFKFSIPSFTGRRKLLLKAFKIDEEQFDLNYNLAIPVPKSIIEFKQVEDESTASNYTKNTKENILIDRMYEINRIEYKDRKENNDVVFFSILKAPEQIIRLDDYIPLQSMEEISRELLEGVRIRVNTDGNAEIRMRGTNEESGYFKDFNKEQPLLFIDGLLINNPNIVAELDPLDVESIEMSYGQFTLNGVDFKGVLAVYTVEGNYPQLNAKSHGYFEINGFQESHKYITPTLDVNAPDFRTLLFWEPDANIEQNTNFNFSTSDEEGSYSICIQGVTESGELISEVKPIEVTSRHN